MGASHRIRGEKLTVDRRSGFIFDGREEEDRLGDGDDVRFVELDGDLNGRVGDSFLRQIDVGEIETADFRFE